jgi:hypothetical protein
MWPAWPGTPLTQSGQSGRYPSVNVRFLLGESGSATLTGSTTTSTSSMDIWPARVRVRLGGTSAEGDGAALVKWSLPRSSSERSCRSGFRLRERCEEGSAQCHFECAGSHFGFGRLADIGRVGSLQGPVHGLIHVHRHRTVAPLQPTFDGRNSGTASAGGLWRVGAGREGGDGGGAGSGRRGRRGGRRRNGRCARRRLRPHGQAQGAA